MAQFAESGRLPHLNGKVVTQRGRKAPVLSRKATAEPMAFGSFLS
jgi:hypothetical protein